MGKGSRLRSLKKEPTEKVVLDTEPKHYGQIGGKLSHINRAAYRFTQRIGHYTNKSARIKSREEDALIRSRVKRIERGEQERIAKKKEAIHG